MDELNAIYEEIKKLIVDNSDFEWEQVVIHSVQGEVHSGFDVDYKINGKYTQLPMLERNGVVSSEKKMAINLGLFHSVVKLFKLGKSGAIDKWSDILFCLKKSGEYKVIYYFNEEDITRMRDEQDRAIYRYKYLGIMPSESDMKYIEGVEQELL